MEERRILESWKEIGVYLRRSTKTCQRWETELDLPVHRLDGTPKARVFAYTDELDRWLAEKLGAGEISTPAGDGKRFPWPALAAVVLLAAAAGYFAVRKGIPPRPHPALDGRSSLTVLRFTNLTGDPALDYLRDMLQEMCTIDICRSSPSLHVRTGEHVCGVLEKLGLADKARYSIKDLRRVAEETDAAMVMTGSYVSSGDSLIINVTVQNPFAPDTVERFEARGTGDASVPDSVGRITAFVKAALGLPDDAAFGGMEQTIADVTTSSPQALQLYVQAVKLRYLFEFEKAIELNNEAVRLDPNFAMAHREIWLNHLEIGNIREAGKAFNKAMELRERLPLNERLFLEGNNTQIPWTERIAAYERLLTYYPGDERALSYLGLYYRLVEDYEKAVERLNAGLRVNKKNIFFCKYLALVYRAMGRYDEAEKVCAQDAANAGRDPDVSAERGLTYACQGKYDLALSETRRAADRLRKKERLRLREGNLHYLAGNFARAEELYRTMARSDTPRQRHEGHYMLGNLYLSLGRFEQAKAEIDEAVKVGDSEDFGLWFVNARIFRAFVEVAAGNIREGLDYYHGIQGFKPNREENSQYLMWKVMFSLADDDLGEAEKALERLAEGSRTRGSNRRSVERALLLLQAAVELKKGNSSEAVDLLERAVSLLPSQHFLGFEESGVKMARQTDPHCFYLDLLASAYYQDGRIEKARETYERITRLTTGRLWDGHKYAMAFYMLGKIYEQKGWPGKAMESYGKFLELWSGADPGIPEIDDARLRLAEIEAR